MELWTKTNIPLTEVHIQFHSKESSQDIKAGLDALVHKGLLEAVNDSTGGLHYIVKDDERPQTGIFNFDDWDKKKALLQEAKNRILAKRKLKSLMAEETPAKTKAASTDSIPAASVPTDSKPTAPTKSAAKREQAIDSDSDALVRKQNKKSLLDHASKLKNPEESLSMGLELAKNATSKVFDGLDKVETFNEERKSPVLSAALSFFLGPLGWLYAGSFKEAIPAFLIGVGIASLLPSVLLFPLMMVGLPASAIGGWLYAWQYNEDGSRKTLFLGDGSDKKE